MEGEGDKKIQVGGERDDPATPSPGGSSGTGTQPGQGGEDGDGTSEIAVGAVGGGQVSSSSSTTTDDGGEAIAGGSPSGNGGWEAGGRIHPLMDQVVLGHLFKFMPPRALATSRLVCRNWRDLSLPTWRYNATVKICSLRLGRGDQHDYYLKDEEWTSLGQFMDFWVANCLIKPYRQFHLERWGFQAGGAAVDVTRFWQGVGSQMTKLRMDNCNTAKLEHFMKVIIKYCPNLDTLILKDFTVGGTFRIWDNREFHVEDEDDRPPNPNPVHGEHSHLKSMQLIYSPDKRFLHFSSLRVHYVELLAHFPHLMSIKVSAALNREDSEVLVLLSAVKEIRAQDPQKLPISELVTDSPMEFFPAPPQNNDEQRPRLRHMSPIQRVKIMRLLLELRIPVRSIRLTGDLSQTETQNIIELGAGILTELIVIVYSSPRHNFPFGLHLENLRHLTTSEGFCRTLELLKYTPNLETLRINDDDIPLGKSILGRPRGLDTDLISNTFKPDLEDVKLLKLRSLTIEFLVRDYDLRWLVRWMPHVKTLRMFLDDRQFAIACENWTELEALNVWGNRLTDSGVTGMMEVKGNGNENEMMVVHPNVTCLQKLKVFSARNSTLTSASLYHGFLKLDRLRQIGFQKAEEMEVAAKEALLQKNVQLQPSRY